MIPLGTWVETGTVLSEHRCTVGLAFWKSAFYFSVNCLTSVVMTVLLWTIYPGFFQKITVSIITRNWVLKSQ